jgi:hypothetical protein
MNMGIKKKESPMIRALFYGGPLHDQVRQMEQAAPTVCVPKVCTAAPSLACETALTARDPGETVTYAPYGSAPLTSPYHCDPTAAASCPQPANVPETVAYQLHWISLGRDEFPLPVYVSGDGLPLAEIYVGFFTSTLLALPDWLTTNRFWLARSIDLAYGEFLNSLIDVVTPHGLQFRH